MPNDVLQRPGSQSGIGRPRALVRLLGPGRSRNADRYYSVLFIVLVVVLGTATIRWPMQVPSALLFPVIVASGVVLSGRGLLLVYALTLGFLFRWMPGSGLSPPRAVLVALPPSSRSWC